jgi:hypothetical protein
VWFRPNLPVSTLRLCAGLRTLPASVLCISPGCNWIIRLLRWRCGLELQHGENTDSDHVQSGVSEHLRITKRLGRKACCCVQARRVARVAD